MGNHYHLLTETPLANLDRIMRHINGVYTQRYNRLKRTDGPLFRGRYRGILIDEDSYLLQVSRYIHRNPLEVKNASPHALDEHQWSSYLAYVNRAKTPDWLNRDRTYRALGGRNHSMVYEAFVLDGNDTRTKEFYSGDFQTGIFGDKSFRQSIYDDRESHEIANRLTEVIDERPDIEEIVAVVARVFRVEPREITMKKGGRQVQNIPRQVGIYCAQRLGRYSQKQVADYFSLSHRGGVSSAVKVIGHRLQAGDLKNQLDEIKDGLYFTKLT